MIARLLTSLLFAICLAGAAQAQVHWSTPGNSCVPDEEAIKFDRHRVGLTSVQHATGNVGLITLNCPITNRFTSMTSAWVISMAYRDSTAMGTSAFVRARLYRLAAHSVLHPSLVR